MTFLLALASPALAQVEFLDETFDYDRDAPAAGHWLGNMEPGGTWGAVLIESGEDGQWSVELTSLAFMAISTPCDEIEIDGRSVAFAVRPSGARFEGAVAADGQRFTGTVTMPGAEGTFEFARRPRPADLPEPMAYSGQVESPLGNLAMTFVFAETPGGNWVGRIDVPMQGLVNVPLTAVSREGRAIEARFDVPMRPARISAELAEDGSRLAGRFQQAGFDLAFDFPRVERWELRRPQEPEPPFPYLEREVTFASEDGHVLAGTLTMPDDGERFTAVVLVSGSGPQDRDETLPFRHKPFLVLADFFTRHGLAVLRYDDRGVGQSGGDYAAATSADLATDAQAGLRFLAGVDRIDPERVGLVGHSEGALIATIVASRSDAPAFIVLLAGPGVPGDELLRVQAELILRATGATEERIAEVRRQQEKLFALTRESAGEEAVEAVRPLVRAQLETLTGLGGDELEQAVEQQISQLASPWMRFFLAYDPRPALRNVSCPVLACNGTLDLQVWHEQNLPEIEKAVRAGGGDVTVRRYEGLNHLFQPAETGSIEEYATIETTFDEGVMRDIVEWIRQVTGDERRFD